MIKALFIVFSINIAVAMGSIFSGFPEMISAQSTSISKLQTLGLAAAKAHLPGIENNRFPIATGNSFIPTPE